MSASTEVEAATATQPTRPYVGPRAFQPGEPLYGRDRESRQLLDLISAERVVWLHSPSGAGKSSLIQAVLVPELEKLRFTVRPIMRVTNPDIALDGDGPKTHVD